MKLWDTFLRFRKKNQTQEPAATTVNEGEERFILSIDGGGMRGIIPVMVLKRLEEKIGEVGKNSGLASYFDLVAGTSTGGLIALALTSPSTIRHRENRVDISAIEEIYMERGSEIFTRNKMDFLGISQVATHKYSKTGIEKLLKEFFLDYSMKDATSPVMVCTYNLSNGSDFCISSSETPDFPVWLAARSTSAAPTYFAPVSSGENLLVDGGVIANNPSVYAYALAKKLYPKCTKFHIVSIGTGAVTQTIKENETSGLLSWLDKVVPMYSTAQKSTCDYILSSLSDVDYVRIDTELEQFIKMDDFSDESMDYMRNFGIKMADDYNSLLTDLSHKLCSRKLKAESSDS